MPDIRLSLSEELLAEVDEDRGRVPRTVWIRDAITDQLNRTVVVRKGSPPAAAPPPKEQPVRTEQTSAVSQGHPFVPAVPGSMRCKCGKPMGAHR